MCRAGYLALMCAAVSMGSTCTSSVVSTTPLHQSDAEFTIGMFEDDPEAAISVRVIRGLSTVRLTAEQDLAVNGESLARNSDTGRYEATIEAAATYVIRVQEPTRGIDETTVAAPDDFDFTSPVDGGDASLSGFTLEWTAEAGALVEVLLTQDLLDDEKRLSLGPMADDGILELTAQQLTNAGFGQGAPLTIALTKILTHDGVDGFDEAEVHIRWMKAIEVQPQP